MFLEHQTLDLFNKMLFEKAQIRPPVRKPFPMLNEACLLYIMKGANGVVSSTNMEMVKEKQALMMKCDNYFFEMLPASQVNTYEAIAVHFYPEVLRKVFENDWPTFLKNDLKTPPKNSMIKLKVDRLLEKYFDSILFYFANPELVSADLLILKVKELFLLLEKTDSQRLREIISNLFTPKTYTFKEVIDAHQYSNLTNIQLAELTHLSLSSFKREFKRIYDESPRRYLRQKKLKKAAKLLRLSDLNITQIAFECGFKDLAHFSIAFKERYGCAPSVYRSTETDQT